MDERHATSDRGRIQVEHLRKQAKPVLDMLSILLGADSKRDITDGSHGRSEEDGPPLDRAHEVYDMVESDEMEDR